MEYPAGSGASKGFEQKHAHPTEGDVRHEVEAEVELPQPPTRDVDPVVNQIGADERKWWNRRDQQEALPGHVVLSKQFSSALAGLGCAAGVAQRVEEVDQQNNNNWDEDGQHHQGHDYLQQALLSNREFEDVANVLGQLQIGFGGNQIARCVGVGGVSLWCDVEIVVAGFLLLSIRPDKAIDLVDIIEGPLCELVVWNIPSVLQI